VSLWVVECFVWATIVEGVALKTVCCLKMLSAAKMLCLVKIASTIFL